MVRLGFSPFPAGTKYLARSKPCFSIQRAPCVSKRSYSGLVRSCRPVWKSQRGTFSSYRSADVFTHKNSQQINTSQKSRKMCHEFEHSDCDQPMLRVQAGLLKDAFTGDTKDDYNQCPLHMQIDI